MRVYVLSSGYRYDDGFDVMGIYSSEEKAEMAKSEIIKDNPIYKARDWEIEEFELDEVKL